MPSGFPLHGFCKAHAEKTHCPQGHPYSGDNLKFDEKGGRLCKICCYQRTKNWLAKQPKNYRAKNSLKHFITWIHKTHGVYLVTNLNNRKSYSLQLLLKEYNERRSGGAQ